MELAHFTHFLQNMFFPSNHHVDSPLVSHKDGSLRDLRRWKCHLRVDFAMAGGRAVRVRGQRQGGVRHLDDLDGAGVSVWVFEVLAEKC